MGPQGSFGIHTRPPLVCILSVIHAFYSTGSLSLTSPNQNSVHEWTSFWYVFNIQPNYRAELFTPFLGWSRILAVNVEAGGVQVCVVFRYWAELSLLDTEELMYIYIYIYIYLSAIGLTPDGSSTVHRLTPGGSSTAHIYTQTVQQYSTHLHTNSTAVQYSSKVHIYTQTVQQYSTHLHTNSTHNTHNRTHITITKLNMHNNKN
jgi:hypothetical protein